MAVVRGNNRYDRNLGLDGQMEAALLEGKEHGLIGVGTRAFGEDEYGLSGGAHGRGGRVKSSEGAGAVGTVNEDGF